MRRFLGIGDSHTDNLPNVASVNGLFNGKKNINVILEKTIVREHYMLIAFSQVKIGPLWCGHVTQLQLPSAAVLFATLRQEIKQAH